MVAFDLPVGSSLLLFDEAAVVPPYVDPAKANPHHRVPGVLRRLAPYYDLAVSSRLPARVLYQLVNDAAADSPAPITCIGNYGLETLWPDGTLSVHARVADENTANLARFSALVRSRYADALARYGASVNTWPHSLAIDWWAVEEREACSMIASNVSRWAVVQGLHSRQSSRSLDVIPDEPQELGTLAELARGPEGRGRGVSMLIYVHPGDPAAKRELLEELVEWITPADAIAIRVAPWSHREPPHGQALVIRVAEREIEVPQPLDGISGVLGWLEELAAACEQGTNGACR